MDRVADAGRLFMEGKSCSQAVFAAFAPSLGMDYAQALRIASGLGGGMHIGATCGAASGAVLALGLRFAGDDSGADRHAVMAAVESFHERFRDQVGAVDCPEILGCDIRTEEGRDMAREQGLREGRCLPAVHAAAGIVERMLREDR